MPGAQTFHRIMDWPKHITVTTYIIQYNIYNIYTYTIYTIQYIHIYNTIQSIIKKVKEFTSIAAKKSMSSAVQEEVKMNDGVSDLTISGDDTWKTHFIRCMSSSRIYNCESY